MSIAISVQLQPSRILRRLHYTTCALLLMVSITVWNMPDVPSTQRNLASLLCVACAGGAIWWQSRMHWQYRLTIAGDGQIQLAWLTPSGSECFSAVELAEGSTIWSGFMLLRLRSEEGKIHRLLLFRDVTSNDNFRALAVAIRWIMRRKMAPKSVE